MKIGKAYKKQFDQKANVNADNMTATGKEKIVGWGMPDYSAAIDISGYNSATNQFTAPCAGECHVSAWAAQNVFVGIYVNDKIISGHLSSSPNASANVVKVSKGDRFYFAGNPYPDAYGAVYNFFPYKGAI